MSKTLFSALALACAAACLPAQAEIALIAKASLPGDASDLPA